MQGADNQPLFLYIFLIMKGGLLMKFKIKGEETKLKMGIKFIRLLDEIYRIDYQGLDFGMGVMYAQIGLNQKSVPTLSDVIRCGLGNDFTQDEVDEAVENFAEENSLSKLFEQVEQALGKSKVVQETMEGLRKAQESVK